VLFGFDILPLTPFWERENVTVLASSLKAMDLCREEGCERLATREALRIFEDAVFSPAMRMGPTWDIRTFVSHLRLNEFDMRDTRDHDLVPLVRRAIERGEIVVLRKGKNSKPTPDETAEQRRLIRKIEQIARTHLSYSGRQYKLVVDVDLAKTPSRDSYEVVGQDDAKRVLDGVAKQSGTVPELTTLLGQASEKLTKDWGPSSRPDGLILLRRIRQTSAAVKDTGPAITPSQMRALKESWITVEVVDNFGLPWQGEIHLVLADGASRDIATDDEGVVHLEAIAAGSVATSIAGLDAEGWQKQ
jgi:hypothetical protein